MAKKTKTVAPKSRVWEQPPELIHLRGEQRVAMENRRRHKNVRYWCFRFQTLLEKGETPEGLEALPGFLEFWVDQVPEYKISPKGERVDVPVHLKGRCVGEMGGYSQFAVLWDVDADLEVYLRHSSVWQEWDNLLRMRVPVLGSHA